MAPDLCPKCGAYWDCGCEKAATSIRTWYVPPATGVNTEGRLSGALRLERRDGSVVIVMPQADLGPPDPRPRLEPL